jgi:hypothetical protein
MKSRVASFLLCHGTFVCLRLNPVFEIRQMEIRDATELLSESSKTSASEERWKGGEERKKEAIDRWDSARVLLFHALLFSLSCVCNCVRGKRLSHLWNPFLHSPLPSSPYHINYVLTIISHDPSLPTPLATEQIKN